MTLLKRLLFLLCVNVLFPITYGQEKTDNSWFNTASTARVIGRFAIEVPLNNISANTITAGRTFCRGVQHVLQTKGFMGLYSGMSVEVLRSGLWYPRMWLLQQGSSQAADLLHLSDHKNMTIHLAAAGVTGLEALTMPLYRVRTALMVEHKDTVRRNIVQVFRTLYTGTGLRSIPTFLTWDAFLFAQAYAKEHMSDRPISRLAFTTGTQMGMAVIMAPIFVVLINRQKLTNPSHLPFWDALKFHYQHHGLPIFARTAGLGAILLGVQAGLTASAIYLEELL